MSQIQSRAQEYGAPGAGEHRLPAARMDPKQDLMDYLETYARENPKVVALWCFGIGFILGWKLKPW